MVELRKVDPKNLWKIVSLAVKPDQTNFVATNTESILEAYVTITSGGIALPFGIYKEDIPVGFVMFTYGSDDETPPVAEGNYCIWRFMIAEPYQRQGLGREALQASLEYLQTLPCGPAESVWLSYEPHNHGAKALYEAMGFRENGEMCGNEVVSVRPLDLPVAP